MSLSDEARRAHAERFLREMLDAVGDLHRFDEVFVGPDGDDFPWMPRSIWSDLEASLLIESLAGAPVIFRLTVLGWQRGVQLSAARRNDELERRCQALVAALKASVAGRSDDGVTEIHEVAGRASLPEPWAANAIKSDLLSAVFPNRHHYVEFDNRSGIIRIPANFGHTYLTL